MVIPWQIAFRLDKECSQALEDKGDTCISDTERVSLFILPGNPREIV